MAEIGQTATNRETGERLVFTGETWAPYERSATNRETGAKAFEIGGQFYTMDQLGTAGAVPGAPQERQGLGEAAMAGAGKLAGSALFGFGDELQGLIGAPIRAARGAAAGYPMSPLSEAGRENLGRAYTSGVEEARGAEKKFQEERPIVGTGLDITGAIAGGAGAAAKLGGRGLIRAFKATPIRTAAGVGAAEGAVFGAGEAEGGLGERAKGAGLGAPTGAAAGLVGGAVGKAFFSLAAKVPGAVNAINKAIRGQPVSDVDKRAMDKVMDLLKQRGISAEDALEAAADAIDNPTPGDLTLDVLGEPGVSLAQGAAIRGTGPANVGVKALRERATKSFDVAGEIVSDAISGKNYKQSIKEFADTRRANAQEAFAAAEQIDIPQRVYRRLLAPFVENNREALRKGLRIAKAEGNQEAYQQLQNALQGKATTLSSRSLGLFLEGLSDLRSTAFRRGDRNLYRALREGEDRFLENVEKVNPDLLRARELYAGDSAIIDAAKFGRDIFSSKLDPEDIADAFKAFTAGEREAALVGAARAIRDKASKASTEGSPVSRFFRSPDQRERLRALFPDDDAYNRFASRLDALISQGRANVAVDPRVNSATASRQSAERAIAGEVIDAGVDAASGGITRTGLNLFRRFAKSIAPDDTKLQEEMARILFETPEEFRPRVIDYIRRQTARGERINPQAMTAIAAGGGQTSRPLLRE